MLQQIIEWDTWLFLKLNSLGSIQWDGFWNFMTNPKSWIPFYVFLLILIFVKVGKRAFFIAVLCIAANVFSTDWGSVNLLKKQVKRLRPCHQVELQEDMRLAAKRCGGKYGFVSSHAANTFGIAVLVSQILRPNFIYLRWFLLMWAAMVAYSRVYLGVHFPLDIICGALYGTLIGWLMGKVYKAVELRFEP